MPLRMRSISAFSGRGTEANIQVVGLSAEGGRVPRQILRSLTPQRQDRVAGPRDARAFGMTHFLEFRRRPGGSDWGSFLCVGCFWFFLPHGTKGTCLVTRPERQVGHPGLGNTPRCWATLTGGTQLRYPREAVSKYLWPTKFRIP